MGFRGGDDCADPTNQLIGAIQSEGISLRELLGSEASKTSAFPSATWERGSDEGHGGGGCEEEGTTVAVCGMVVVRFIICLTSPYERRAPHRI